MAVCTPFHRFLLFTLRRASSFFDAQAPGINMTQVKVGAKVYSRGARVEKWKKVKPKENFTQACCRCVARLADSKPSEANVNNRQHRLRTHTHTLLFLLVAESVRSNRCCWCHRTRKQQKLRNVPDSDHMLTPVSHVTEQFAPQQFPPRKTLHRLRQMVQPTNILTCTVVFIFHSHKLP